MDQKTTRLHLESLGDRIAPAVLLPAEPLAVTARVAALSTTQITVTASKHGGSLPIDGQVKVSDHAKVLRTITVSLYWSRDHVGATDRPVATHNFNANIASDNIGYRFSSKEIPSNMLSSGHFTVVVKVNGQTITKAVN